MQTMQTLWLHAEYTSHAPLTPHAADQEQEIILCDQRLCPVEEGARKLEGQIREILLYIKTTCPHDNSDM